MTFFESKNELLAIQSQYESVLVDTTHFPRAGNTNQRYVHPQFADTQNFGIRGARRG